MAVRSKPQCVSVSKRRKAEELFAQGKGYKFVTHELGLNVYTVRDWGRLFRKGKFRPDLRHPSSDKNTIRDRKTQALTLFREGRDELAIAIKLGVSVITVRRYLKEFLVATITNNSASALKE